MADTTIETETPKIAASRWPIRIFVALLLFSTLIPVEWYRNPRVRAQFYRAVFILGSTKLRHWSLDHLNDFQLSMEKDILADCYCFALSDEEKSIRNQAISGLPFLGRHRGISIRALSSRLTNSDSVVRHCVVKTLGYQGERAAPAVPMLIKLLTDPDVEIRFATLEALAGIGRGAVLAEPMLTKILLDPSRSWYCRAEAAKALGAIGPASAPAVPALIKCLKTRDSEFLPHGVEALGDIGPKAAAAVPALIEILITKPPIMIDTFDTIQYKWPMSPSKAKIAAIVALGKIGPAAAPAIPKLVAFLSNPWTGEATISALGKIGPNSTTIPILIPFLSHSDLDIRQRTILVLGTMGQSALPALLKARKNEDPAMRESSNKAITIIEAKGLSKELMPK
ncbi:MAG: HEAT repeat domain-containing protein [Planctomycetota bacterium]|nr:HEAT repeat domain-containing protein [Planctomycetota bacterium]